MEGKDLCAVERRGRVHLITITGAGDHRLNPALLAAIRSAVAASAGAGTTTPCFVIRLVAGRSIEGKALVVSGEPSNG